MYQCLSAIANLVGCVSDSVMHRRIIDDLLDLGRLINKSGLYHSMTSYRSGTYFFTQVTHQRQPWLCTDVARPLLRAAFLKVREKYAFAIELEERCLRQSFANAPEFK
ncbi:MAG: hypothetical protein RM021_034490 [Nostoc sp. EkiNYC01]|nr:hypothetical protein [Nostoc sp. EkiNYC01]